MVNVGSVQAGEACLGVAATAPVGAGGWRVCEKQSAYPGYGQVGIR